MGYKYKGNFPHGKDGTSYRGRDNNKPRFGTPCLRESKDLFAKDSDRRDRNPNTSETVNTKFNQNRIGWVEERAVSTVASRKADQPQLTYDSKALPRNIIDSKQEFDRLLNDGTLDNSNIPYFYRQIKYPSTYEEQYPHSNMSSLIFRQQNEKLIKDGYDNTPAVRVDKTGFYISDTYQWGASAVIDPGVSFTSSLRYANRIYSLGGFNNSFISDYKKGFFITEPRPPFKYHPVGYELLSPEGPMLSNLIKNNLIKGEPQETLFSGYRDPRVSSILGL